MLVLSEERNEVAVAKESRPDRMRSDNLKSYKFVKYFHISYTSGIPFLYSIINRLNAIKEPARNELGTWDLKMGDAAIALSTKIHTLQVAVQRLEKDISALDAEISAKAETVDECIAEKPPRALILENQEIGFRLIASLDAFLYEARSEYEMLRTFALMFRRHILKKRCNETEAEQILKRRPLPESGEQ